VRLAARVAIDLRNYDRWARLPPGLEPFAFPDRGRNAWLKTRLAEPGLGAIVASDTQLGAALERIQQHPALREFTLADDRVEMVFDFGARGLFPIEHAERVLGLGVDVAERAVNL